MSKQNTIVLPSHNSRTQTHTNTTILLSHLARQRHGDAVKAGRHRALDRHVARRNHSRPDKAGGPQLDTGDGGGAFSKVAAWEGGMGGGKEDVSVWGAT